MGTGIDYVVDDEGLTDDEVKAIDRAALATLGGDAVHVETDLPGHDPGAWPVDSKPPPKRCAATPGKAP